MLYLVRYGELALKSPQVRQRFEHQLLRNLRSSFRAARVDARVSRGFGRFYVSAPLEHAAERKIERILARTFGIVSFSPCERLPADLETLEAAAVRLARRMLPRGQPFRVDAHRVGKHAFTSQHVNVRIGAAIQKALGNPVDLTHPAVTVSIDIRDREAYLFSRSLPGPGGLPAGTGPPLAALLDRPDGSLAAWLALRRGSPIHPIFVNASAPQRKRWLAQLQPWSPWPLKHASVRTKAPRSAPRYLEELFAAIKKAPSRRSRGIAFISAETELSRLAAEKAASPLPVLWPLAGLPKAQVEAFARRMATDGRGRTSRPRAPLGSRAGPRRTSPRRGTGSS